MATASPTTDDACALFGVTAEIPIPNGAVSEQAITDWLEKSLTQHIGMIRSTDLFGGGPPPSSGESVILTRVTFEVAVPRGLASKQDVLEWLLYHLKRTGSLRATNPLARHTPRARPGTIQWDVVRAGVLSSKPQTQKDVTHA